MVSSALGENGNIIKVYYHAFPIDSFEGNVHSSLEGGADINQAKGHASEGKRSPFSSDCGFEPIGLSH